MRNPFARAKVRWNDWNIGHCTKHGADEAAVEYIIRHPESRFPRRSGRRKYLIHGRLPSGQRLQVIVLRDDVPWMQVFPIHAMPLVE